MSDIFINERVKVNDLGMTQYPHLKDLIGCVTNERKLPPFGKCLVVRFSINGAPEWTYLKANQVSSAEKVISS